MKNNHFSIQDQIDLVQYREKLGYRPANIKNQEYWYSSLLRDEKTPSFKI
ncbi:MAG: hypothetical protein ABIN89_07605 [Chitinophagaceae bacterium]